MNKSILVIDTPKRCGDCHLCYKDNFDTDSWFTYRCIVSDDKVEYDNIYENCPLKLMPQKFGDELDCPYGFDYMMGWDECLDELLGGKENEN